MSRTDKTLTKRAALFDWVAVFLVAVVSLGVATLPKACKAADRWTATDTMLELGYVAVALADALQTADIKNHPEIVETNPVLVAMAGENPSDAATAVYFSSAVVLHAAVSYMLPRGKWRTLWQSGTLAINGGIVANNASLGLRVRY